MIAISASERTLRSLELDDDGNLKVVASGVALTAGDISVDLTSTNALLTDIKAQNVSIIALLTSIRDNTAA